MFCIVVYFVFLFSITSNKPHNWSDFIIPLPSRVWDGTVIIAGRRCDFPSPQPLPPPDSCRYELDSSPAHVIVPLEA